MLPTYVPTSSALSLSHLRYERFQQWCPRQSLCPVKRRGGPNRGVASSTCSYRAAHQGPTKYAWTRLRCTWYRQRYLRSIDYQLHRHLADIIRDNVGLFVPCDFLFLPLVAATSHIANYSLLEVNPKRQRGKPIPGNITRLVEHAVADTGSLTYSEAAATFGVSPASVHRIVAAKRRRDDARPANPAAETPELIKPRRKRRSPLTEAILLQILCLIDEDCTVSLRDIVKIVKDRFNTQTSKSAVDRALRSMDITWKTVSKVPVVWNSPENIESRRNYCAWLLSSANTNKVYVDECSINLHIYKSRGRAPKGITPPFNI